MEYFKLRNGIEIPAVGSGTNTFGRADDRYESPLNGDFTAMRSAIEVGYRMFDTAMAYGNEDGIGEEIAKSGIPRSEFFIMGKIPNRAPYNSSPENIRKSVEDSLKNLKTDYFDMFLIHKAVDDAAAKRGEKMNVEKTLELWGVLEELLKEGKFRGIGVSNFEAEHLKAFVDGKWTVLPMVNEIRCNPAMRNREAVALSKELGIQPIAHSPLSFSIAPGVFAVDEDYKAKLAAIGEKYGKHWAQVQLRYNFQSGIVSIPKSSNPKNQASNLNIFDFALTDEEMAQLS